MQCESTLIEEQKQIFPIIKLLLFLLRINKEKSKGGRFES